MSDKQLFEPEKLSIVDFKFIQNQVSTSEDFITEHVQGYQLENSLELAFNLGEKLVKADFTLEVKTDSKGANLQESAGVFHLLFIYKVDNLEELVEPEQNNMLRFHPSLGNAISSITYSTSRGILMTRLQGTALQNFILPVINPNKLIYNK